MSASSSSWFLGALGGDVLSIDSSKTDKLNWHKTRVFDMVYAVVSNEDYVVAGGGASIITVFSARNEDDPALLWTIETETRDEDEPFEYGTGNNVLCLALSSSSRSGGPLLLVGGNNHQVQLWRLTPPAAGATAAQRPLCIFDQGQPVAAVTFCPDGQRFLSGSSDGTDGKVNLWSFVADDDGTIFDDGKMRNEPLFNFHDYDVAAVVMGHLFAAVVDDWGLILLHPETGLILDKFERSRLGPVVVLSRDERFVLLGPDDGTKPAEVIVYDVHARAIASTVKIPGGGEITAMRPLDDAHSVGVCCGKSVFIVFPAVGRVTRVYTHNDGPGDFFSIAF